MQFPIDVSPFNAGNAALISVLSANHRGMQVINYTVLFLQRFMVYCACSFYLRMRSAAVTTERSAHSKEQRKMFLKEAKTKGWCRCPHCGIFVDKVVNTL